MNFGISLTVTALLVAIPLAAGSSPTTSLVFGGILPFSATLIFLVGVIYRVITWGRSPVPFRIPTTAGQAKSLSWIKSNWMDNPPTGWLAAWRVVTEVLFFRSLFRNTKAELHNGTLLAYGTSKWLWLGGMAFHYSFLLILLRHLRFFTEPTPECVKWIQFFDGFFQVGVPGIFITDILILAALLFLLARRLWDAKLRYISLPADYFPLLLIIAIALTGVWMRYFGKVDLYAVKEAALALASLRLPTGRLPTMFLSHLFLVSALFAYFPFSKLMHLGGIFLSPTRNLANNNRSRRQINPWNEPLPIHTYEEYEEEFREVMKGAGLPVEKD